MTHLDDEQVVAALEGGPAAAHAATCGACARRVQDLRDAMDVARLADVPEPSPFYWASFRRQVRGRIEADAVAGPRPRAWTALAALAAAAALAVVVLRGPATTPVPTPSAAPLPSWSALPEDDPAADVLAALGSDTDLLSEAGCDDVAGCVAGLTDDESREVVALLRRELAEGGKL